MTVYKDKRTGNYCYRFMYHGVLYHRCFKGCKKDDVIKYETVARSELIKDNYDISKVVQYTLKDILKDYIEYADNNYSYPDDAKKIAEKFVALNGNILAEQITLQELEHYRKSRKGKVTNSSINREMNNIKRMFSLAKSNHKIRYNPCDELKSLRIVNKPKRFLTKEEEIKLLAVANPMMKAIIITAIQTGMRLSEITNLKWSDVYMDKGYIVALNTKNNKPRKLIITPDIKNVLNTLDKSSEYVFTNPITKTKYNDILSTFRRTVERSGIPHISFHELRHTTASRMNELGIDLATIQEYLDHASSRTTQGYIHKPKQNILDAVRKLSEY